MRLGPREPRAGPVRRRCTARPVGPDGRHRRGVPGRRWARPGPRRHRPAGAGRHRAAGRRPDRAAGAVLCIGRTTPPTPPSPGASRRPRRSCSTRRRTRSSARTTTCSSRAARPGPTGRSNSPWSSAGAARYLDSPDEALDHVAGYVVSNDVSERDFQLDQSGGQWSKGKSLRDVPTRSARGSSRPTRCRPAGPAAAVLGQRRAPPGLVHRRHDLRRRVPDLAPVASTRCSIPGDVINTGTPEGVALSGRFPYLQPGDMVEVEIDGLGRQRSVMAAS